MRRVRTEIAASIGPQLLDGYFGSHHASSNDLLLTFKRGGFGSAFECHGHALRDQDGSDEQRKWQEEPYRGAGYVYVEVADLIQPVASQRPNDRDAGGNAGRSGH